MSPRVFVYPYLRLFTLSFTLNISILFIKPFPLSSILNLSFSFTPTLSFLKE